MAKEIRTRFSEGVIKLLEKLDLEEENFKAWLFEKLEPTFAPGKEPTWELKLENAEVVRKLLAGLSERIDFAIAAIVETAERQEDQLLAQVYLRETRRISAASNILKTLVEVLAEKWDSIDKLLNEEESEEEAKR